MRGMVAAVIAAMLMPTSALALSDSQVPLKFNIPFGNSAGSSYIRTIPQNSQIGIQNCAASLTDGFPPLTFVPASAGGCPPFGVDFNGIFNQITAWSRWQAAGVMAPYDSAFQAAIGGYPNEAIIPSGVTPNLWWQSSVDNNASNPDTGGSNWQGVGYVPTGMISPFGGATAPPGYLLCYGQQVSRSTYFALFAVIGTAYGIGDGSSTFNLPDLRGRTVYGPDAMGGTPANRITTAGGGFSATIGAAGGAQNQTLTQAQMAAVSPSFSGTPQTWNLSGTTQTWNLNQSVTQGIGTQLVQAGNLAAFSYNVGGTNQNASVTVTPNGTTTVTPAGSINGFSGFGGQSHPILSPGQVASYIIKY